MHRSSILLIIFVIGLYFKSYSSVCVTRRRPIPPFLLDPDRPRDEYSNNGRASENSDYRPHNSDNHRVADDSEYRPHNSDNHRVADDSEYRPHNSDNPRVADDSEYRPHNSDNPKVPDESGYRPHNSDNPKVPDDSEYRPVITEPQPITETPRTAKSTFTTVTEPTTTSLETTHSSQTTTITETTEAARTTKQVSTAGCPNGFYRFGQYCYYVSPQDVYDSIDKAQKHCENSNSKATLLDLGTYTSQDQDQLNSFFASGLTTEYAFPADISFDNGTSKYKWNSNKQNFDCKAPIKFQYCNVPISEYPFVWIGASNPFELENTYVFSYSQIICQLKV